MSDLFNVPLVVLNGETWTGSEGAKIIYLTKKGAREVEDSNEVDYLEPKHISRTISIDDLLECWNTTHKENSPMTNTIEVEETGLTEDEMLAEFSEQVSDLILDVEYDNQGQAMYFSGLFRHDDGKFYSFPQTEMAEKEAA